MLQAGCRRLPMRRLCSNALWPNEVAAPRLSVLLVGLRGNCPSGAGLLTARTAGWLLLEYCARRISPLVMKTANSRAPMQTTCGISTFVRRLSASTSSACRPALLPCALAASGINEGMISVCEQCRHVSRGLPHLARVRGRGEMKGHSARVLWVCSFMKHSSSPVRSSTAFA